MMMMMMMMMGGGGGGVMVIMWVVRNQSPTYPSLSTVEPSGTCPKRGGGRVVSKAMVGAS
jgi:hypothetical protein